jgi:IMP dehydrogenase/GMP reductase
MLPWLIPHILKQVGAFLSVDRHPSEIPVSALPPQSVRLSKESSGQYHKGEDEKALLTSRGKKFVIEGRSRNKRSSSKQPKKSIIGDAVEELKDILHQRLRSKRSRIRTS